MWNPVSQSFPLSFKKSLFCKVLPFTLTDDLRTVSTKMSPLLTAPCGRCWRHRREEDRTRQIYSSAFTGFSRLNIWPLCKIDRCIHQYEKAINNQTIEKRVCNKQIYTRCIYFSRGYVNICQIAPIWHPHKAIMVHLCLCVHAEGHLEEVGVGGEWFNGSGSRLPG